MNKVDEFNIFFKQNYNYLLNFSKSFNKYIDYEDLLHNTYIKCLNRIQLSGFSGSTYLNFMRVAITNGYKTHYRDKKKQVELDYHISEIDTYLQSEYQYHNNKIQQRENADIVNTYIFEYVNKYFDEKHERIFKSYYLLRYRHINYKKLSEITGYSITTVSNIIRYVKEQLKINLECYIYTGLNVMELKELIAKVEKILTTEVRQNLQNYKEVYKLVFGKPYTGCNCTAHTMKPLLKQWLEKNKIYIT